MYDTTKQKIRTQVHISGKLHLTPLAQQNLLVRNANIQCWAIGCTEQATRYSHLCYRCERYSQYRGLKPVFGTVNAEQTRLARSILKASLGVPQPVINDWNRRYWLAMQGEAIPERLTLGIDREKPSRRSRIYLHRFMQEASDLKKKVDGPLTSLSLFLAFEAFVLPKAPSVLKGAHAQPYVARKMFGRLRTKYFPDAVGKNGMGLLRAMRRSDLKVIGNLILRHASPLFLAPGGRKSGEWRDMSDALFVAYFQSRPEELDVWSSS